MTVNKLTDLGPKVSVDEPTELHYQRTALGNGIGKPGYLAYVNSTNGKIAGVDPINVSRFDGIAVKPYYNSTDDIIPDGSGCQLIRPKQGQRYRVMCNSGLFATDFKIGAQIVWDWSTTGQVLAITGMDTINYPITGATGAPSHPVGITGQWNLIGRLAKDKAAADKYLDMVWGG